MSFPRWLVMPSAFYRKVERIARKHGIKETEVLEMGVDVITRTPALKYEKDAPAILVPEVGRLHMEVAHRAWRFLAKTFAGRKKISAEQRRANSLAANRARWDKQKQQPPKP